MGWLDTPEERRRQHLQMIAHGNIRDIDRIQERERKRRITTFLWVLAVLALIVAYFCYKLDNIKWLIVCALIGVGLILYLVFRGSGHRPHGHSHRHHRRHHRHRHR